MSGRKEKTFAAFDVTSTAFDVITFVLFAVMCGGVMLQHLPAGRYGLTVHSPWWTEATYMWLHASWVHLGMNLWVAWQLWGRVRMRELVPGVAIAMLVPDFCLCDIPTVGLSGLLFALLGVMWYRFRNKGRIQVLMWTLLLFSLGAWALGAAVNPFIHLWCYSTGLAAGVLVRPSWKRI